MQQGSDADVVLPSLQAAVFVVDDSPAGKEERDEQYLTTVTNYYQYRDDNQRCITCSICQNTHIHVLSLLLALLNCWGLFACCVLCRLPAASNAANNNNNEAAAAAPRQFSCHHHHLARGRRPTFTIHAGLLGAGSRGAAAADAQPLLSAARRFCLQELPGYSRVQAALLEAAGMGRGCSQAV